MKKPKYKVGDRVKIIKYGHLFWLNKSVTDISEETPVFFEDDDFLWFDMSPELVGKIGYVSEVTITQEISQYALDGIKSKSAWYDEGQLRKLKQNKL